MGLLDTVVSYFDNVYTSKPTAIVGLKEWLTTDCYKKEIELLRKTSDKRKRTEIKRNLPAITPSGIFHPTRRTENLADHTGLICIDIDKGDNLPMGNPEKLKAGFAEVPEVAFCGLSASGNGLYLLIPIEDGNKHNTYFTSLKKYFLEAWDVVIDNGCGDVTRLRGISYDANRYINEDAAILKSTSPAIEFGRDASIYFHSEMDSNQQLHQLLSPILAQGIDITASRDDWFKVCSVIANECGENGRELFHAISSFYPKYNPKECNGLYDDLLKRPPYNYGLGTIVHIVKQYI